MTAKDLRLPGANMKEFCIAAAILLITASNLKAQLNAYFINVGQGDAIYLELPNGANALIDGGPSGEPVYQFLKGKGVTKLDRVLLTHPHSDHYRGLKKVFNSFEVDKYYDTRAENVDAIGDNNLRELAAAEPGCRTLYPEPASELKWDSNVTVKVLKFLHRKGTDTRQQREQQLLPGDPPLLQRRRHTADGRRRRRHRGRDDAHLQVRPQLRLVASGAQIYTTVGGTQSLTIPAPKKGVALMINGQIDFAPSSLTETPAFNMEEHPFESADAAALKQLSETSK